MKTKCFIVAGLLFSLKAAYCEPIDQLAAKKVASGFLSQFSAREKGDLNLVYTGKLENGSAGYYAFTMSAGTGFIIISADNATHPLIGYSLENSFAVPETNSNLGYWLQKRIHELEYIQSHHIVATPAIREEWEQAVNSGSSKRTSASSVAPLVHTTWNQSPHYNSMCPSLSITGCVATAMAQIMKYWEYPATGTGSSSYCDCIANGKKNNYGILSANYGATTYNWTSMPLHVSSPNADVALLMYHCGVSVEMDYDPNGSGAWVISVDKAVCSQASYVNYFGYDPKTIRGLMRASYRDDVWMELLKNDLDLGRPIQYVGWDMPQGGHTWVCDGYDLNDNLHMNWGWGGSGNGYFTIYDMDVSGYNPIEYEQALIGIKPPSKGTDIGISAITALHGTTCNSASIPVVKLENFGNSVLNSCTINFTLDHGSLQTQAWSGSLATYQSVLVPLTSLNVSPGTHTFVCSAGNPDSGTDVLASNDESAMVFYAGTTGLALPVSEGFEGSTALPLSWTIENPDEDVSWQVNPYVARSGNNCIAINNCVGNGNGTDLSGRKDRFLTQGYDFSTSVPQAMTFAVAYSPYFNGSSFIADSLTVSYSLDCGNSWSAIYKKGSSLATASPFEPSDTQYCWEPIDKSEWRNEIVNLSMLIGSPNVMFAFENSSSSAQWLFIDNINILAASAVGINTVEAEGFLRLYPNPAKEFLTIEGLQGNGNLAYSIYNLSGQELKAGNIAAGSNGFKESIRTGDLANGLYIIRLSDGKNSWVKKFNVQ
jgi:hypothetical protein